MNHFEVVPLRVSLGVEIVFEPQVVLDVVHFDGSAQVAVLKPAVKYQDVLLLRHVYCELVLTVVFSLRREFRQVLE